MVGVHVWFMRKSAFSTSLHSSRVCVTVASKTPSHKSQYQGNRPPVILMAALVAQGERVWGTLEGFKGNIAVFRLNIIHNLSIEAQMCKVFIGRLHFLHLDCIHKFHLHSVTVHFCDDANADANV